MIRNTILISFLLLCMAGTVTAQGRMNCILLNGQSSGTISRNSLQDVSELQCSDSTYRVSSFVLTMNSGSDLISLRSPDGRVSNAMKSKLSEARKGQKIFFEEIIISNADGISIPCIPSTFVIGDGPDVE